MLLRMGVNADLHPVMRPVLKYAERAFLAHAQREAIITSARDREHSAGSWHYYGLAVDFRTRDLDDADISAIVQYLKRRLPEFQVIFEGSHIHVEIGPELETRLNFRG